MCQLQVSSAPSFPLSHSSIPLRGLVTLHFFPFHFPPTFVNFALSIHPNPAFPTSICEFFRTLQI